MASSCGSSFPWSTTRRSSIARGRTWVESYRSVIFYANDEQQKISKDYIAQLDAAKVFRKPIVTQVVPLKGFYDAEAYHQDYALHNPNNPYIMVCDRPKIEALKKQFPELFKGLPKRQDELQVLLAFAEAAVVVGNCFLVPRRD